MGDIESGLWYFTLMRTESPGGWRYPRLCEETR
jgi:hypothetical protein